MKEFFRITSAILKIRKNERKDVKVGIKRIISLQVYDTLKNRVFIRIIY